MDAITQAGFDNDMKLNEIVYDGQWEWPAEWYVNYPVVQTIPPPKINEASKDRYLWCTNDGRYVQYSTNRAWKDWRINGN